MGVEYLTPAQVAARLTAARLGPDGKRTFSVVTVQRYCRAGLFSGAIRVGQSWGIPPAALDGFEPPPIGNPDMGPGFWAKSRKKGRKSKGKK